MDGYATNGGRYIKHNGLSEEKTGHKTVMQNKQLAKIKF